jgi:spore coat polysaccharide biosynthesis protein SpsF (cytidylyltransferase family)
LLAKESIGLPDIIRILGDRPFPMKETVKEYLQELMERKDKENATSEAATSEGEESAKEDQTTKPTEEKKAEDS